MYHVADGARRRTLQIMMMVEKRHATRQQKEADEKRRSGSPFSEDCAVGARL
jgi:hypothetical protein